MRQRAATAPPPPAIHATVPGKASARVRRRGWAGRGVGRRPGYRVTVPVKVSRPPPSLDSAPVIRPPPPSPSKLPRPFTTSQSLRCFTSGGVDVKATVRVPPEHRNILVTKSLPGSFLSPNRPPTQKAESPRVDPVRTSPVVSPFALTGARCVLI